MIKKVVVRGGHNFQTAGASGIIDETTEDRKVKSSVIKYLKLGGCTVIDGTPGNCSENADLNFGTNTANNNHADLFLPIHFNKCYNSYNGKIGSEVWLNPNNSTSVAVGKRIMSKLVGLGFKDRGLKDGINGEHLHDIKASNMPSVLIEVCFVEATEDVALYKKIGFDVVGKAIAEGILDKKIGTSTNVTPASTETYTVRLSYNNKKSQLISTSDLYEAKDKANSHPSYSVYNSKGQNVYMLKGSPIPETYRIRLAWNDEKSQIGEIYTDYYQAKDFANLHVGYNVYDSKGKNLYTLAVVKPVVPNTDIIYRVVAGSFKDESGADEQIVKLAKLGIESFKTIK